MTDVFSKKKRSEVMSRIRSKGNKKTELRLIEILKKHSIKGWRRNYPIYGKPDFVFPKHRLAIFVDGCFWHGCPEHYNKPATNREFWRKKLESNIKRDEDVNTTLRKKNWTVLRIWQHELKDKNQVVTKILSSMK